VHIKQKSVRSGSAFVLGFFAVATGCTDSDGTEAGAVGGGAKPDGSAELDGGGSADADLVLDSAPPPGSGATITAASCSASDVEAALNQASAGDTVQIPAGTCHWTTGLYWTAPPNVTLRGAGSLTGVGTDDQTIIVDDYENSNPLLSITTSATGAFRICGLSFRGGDIASVENSKFNGLVQVAGNTKQLRVDHINCSLRTYALDQANQKHPSGRCFNVVGWIYGVMDHNSFELPDNTGQAIMFANGLAYDDLPEGDGAWAAATELGSPKFVFVEDSTFSSQQNTGTAQDCYAGGRFVWRYNTMNAASLQTHPTGGAGRGRGCRAWEIYGNTFNSVGLSAPLFNVWFLSSGTGVIWGNTVPSPSEFKHFVTLHSMRRNNATYTQSPTPNGWGWCGSSHSGNGSEWDGNTSTTTGYPCLDQPGRGRGDLLAGAFPDAMNATTGTIAWPNQAWEPFYLWLNPFTPMPGWGGSFEGSNTVDVAENRDYFDDEGPDTDCAAGGSICKSGVGSGSLAQRPANCTPGTAWWAPQQGGDWNTANGAANDGALYRCTSTNTWELFYVPYQYPHPLNE
jgi:hypothetical protein